MIAEAFAPTEVDTVIAHTLPEHNASNRVLEKLQFHRDGNDIEDGQTVWRYTLSRQS